VALAFLEFVEHLAQFGVGKHTREVTAVKRKNIFNWEIVLLQF
jgi:hypothetical protein